MLGAGGPWGRQTNKVIERSLKPWLPPLHPEKEQQQGEGYFISVDTK